MKIPGVFLILSSIAIALPVSAQTSKDLLCRGVYELGDHRYGEAITSFSQAIRSNPRFADAYFYRGVTHHYKKRFPEAIANYNQALLLGTRYPATVLTNRASALAEFGDYKQALEDLKLVVQYIPDSAKPFKAMAFSFLKLGSRKSAIAALEKAAAISFRSGDSSAYLETRDDIKKVRGGGSFYHDWTFYIEASSWVRCP